MMRKLLALLLMIISFCFAAGADDGTSSLGNIRIDEEKFEIEAILPSSSSGGETATPIHTLVIQDLYMDDHNVIEDGREVDMGGGSRLFSSSPVSMFSVRHTTNNLAPVTLEVKVTPFTQASADGSTTVLPTTIQSVAGFDALGTVYDEIDGQKTVVMPENRSDNPGRGKYAKVSGGQVTITSNNGSTHKSNGTENGRKATAQTSSKAESTVIDKYTFSYETYRESSNGYWTWSWSNHYYYYTPGDIPLSACDSSNFLDGGDGYITNYIDYSACIDENDIGKKPGGTYIMTVTATMSYDG